MSASVPEQRIELVQRDSNAKDITAISRSIRAVTWVDAARLQCWIAGRGSMEVPCHNPMVTVSAETETFRYWVKPRYQTTRYALHIACTSESQVGNAIVYFPDDAADGVTIPVTNPRNVTPATVFMDVDSQSTNEMEIAFKLNVGSIASFDVHSIAIEAVPRAVLDTAGSDLGADRLRHWVRQPIMAPYIASEILGRQNELRNATRKVGQFQFCRGTDIVAGTPGWSFNSGTWTGLFDDGVSNLGRYLYSGDTTRTMSWRVLAYCTDGTTAGEIRVNNDGGTGVSTITIPAGTTSLTWLPSTAGAAGTFTCRAEDNTAALGLRSSSWDDHTFEARRTAGVGDVRILTVSVFDAG